MFQFTHPRGVRHGTAKFGNLRIGFQFTHPRGVRHQQNVRNLTTTKVSIHAPARGATFLRYLTYGRAGCFNSRTREGCDM